MSFHSLLVLAGGSWSRLSFGVNASAFPVIQPPEAPLGRLMMVMKDMTNVLHR